jgi:type VI secretion system protein ImpB
MSKTLGSVAPKERINIRYVPATGDNQSGVELPLKMLVTGDFKGRPEHIALEERRAVLIDKDTFDDVLAAAGVNLGMAVPSRLGHGAASELNVQLQISAISDFGPDAIARQVPELNKLLELREALVALKGPLGNVPAFRKHLQALLADEQARAQLAAELDLTLDAPQA